MQVNAGQIISRENEPSDSIYMVLHGRLRTIREKNEGDLEILGEFGHGESVGELEVLSMFCYLLVKKKKKKGKNDYSFIHSFILFLHFKKKKLGHPLVQHFMQFVILKLHVFLKLYSMH